MPVYDDDRKPLSGDEKPITPEQMAEIRNRLHNRAIKDRLIFRQCPRDDAWQNGLLPPKQSVLLPLPSACDERTIFWWDEVPLPFYQQGGEWRWQTEDEYTAELRRILASWLVGIEDPAQAERRAAAKEERKFLDATITLMLPASIYSSRVLMIADRVLVSLCKVIDVDCCMIEMPVANREQIVSALRPFAKVNIYLAKEE